MKILLLCYGGMSTGIMKVKIEEAAIKDGFSNVFVTATSLTEGLEIMDDYDLFLLGPQVRYAEKEVVKKSNEKPVIVIAPSDFGLMRGDKVWLNIKKHINSINNSSDLQNEEMED